MAKIVTDEKRVDPRPCVSSLLRDNACSKLGQLIDRSHVRSAELRRYRIADTGGGGRNPPRGHADSNVPRAMNSHRREVSGFGNAGNIYQPAKLLCIRCNRDVRLLVSGCGNDDVGSRDVLHATVRPALEFDSVVLFRQTREVAGHLERDDSDAGARSVKSHGLARADTSSANDERPNLVAIQSDGDRAQRNWPRSRDAARKTTYMTTTLAKVMADIIAARLACSPCRILPRARAATQIQAPSPHTICGTTRVR